MSRWKRLEDLDARLDDMTAEQLRDALPYWRAHAATLRGPGHKLAMKRIHRLERALALKEREADA